MTNQFQAWNLTNSVYTPTEAGALEAAAEPYPELDNAVRAKAAELNRRTRTYEQRAAKEARDKAAKEGTAMRKRKSQAVKQSEQEVVRGDARHA